MVAYCKLHKEVIEHANKENGNTAHNPESINLTLAERILKEYALKNVFDPDISEAHLSGEIHIHDLGMIDRFYCSGHSPEYVKKNGIRNIPTIPSNSKPANSANVLARHICSFTQFLQGQFAGAIGWEAINVFFATLLENMPYKEIKQLVPSILSINQENADKEIITVYLNKKKMFDDPNKNEYSVEIVKCGEEEKAKEKLIEIKNKLISIIGKECDEISLI